MKLVMAANLFFGMNNDILMEYYLQKYGYSCTGPYTMLPATMKLELVQSLRINYGPGILSYQISWWAFIGSCTWLFWRKMIEHYGPIPTNLILLANKAEWWQLVWFNLSHPYSLETPLLDGWLFLIIFQPKLGCCNGDFQ